MKQYLGIKKVMAEPMNEQAAVAKGFARKNTDRHEWRDGYHVQYTNPDGSTYDSWSPKQVFEQSYHVSETFLDRMHIEYDELNDRTQRLEDFVKTDKFYHLGAIQQGRLLRRLSAMQQYREWLRLRIEDCEQHQ